MEPIQDGGRQVRTVDRLVQYGGEYMRPDLGEMLGEVPDGRQPSTLWTIADHRQALADMGIGLRPVGVSDRQACALIRRDNPSPVHG